jgi:hypothetical protein
MDRGNDRERLNEIDIELKKIQELFKEYQSWYDKETGKVWFPPGRYFDYDKLVVHEQDLLTERKAISERLTGSA